MDTHSNKFQNQNGRGGCRTAEVPILSQIILKNLIYAYKIPSRENSNRFLRSKDCLTDASAWEKLSVSCFCPKMCDALFFIDGSGAQVPCLKGYVSPTERKKMLTKLSGCWQMFIDHFSFADWDSFKHIWNKVTYCERKANRKASDLQCTRRTNMGWRVIAQNG